MRTYIIRRSLCWKPDPNNPQEEIFVMTGDLRIVLEWVPPQASFEDYRKQEREKGIAVIDGFFGCREDAQERFNEIEWEHYEDKQVPYKEERAL